MFVLLRSELNLCPDVPRAGEELAGARLAQDGAVAIHDLAAADRRVAPRAVSTDDG